MRWSEFFTQVVRVGRESLTNYAVRGLMIAPVLCCIVMCWVLRVNNAGRKLEENHAAGTTQLVPCSLLEQSAAIMTALLEMLSGGPRSAQMDDLKFVGVPNSFQKRCARRIFGSNEGRMVVAGHRCPRINPVRIGRSLASRYSLHRYTVTTTCRASYRKYSRWTTIEKRIRKNDGILECR